VVIGRGVVLISSSRHTALGVSHPVVLRTLRADARIELADSVGISGGSICAAVLVSIGAGTLLGADVTVADTDFHPIRHPRRRHAPLPEPRPEDAVVIGSNVFIGTRAIVLKGSRIGDDAVVGAGAVVSGEVPAGSIVAGNPARPVGQRATEPGERG
jgi:acetyltransferase-like isoleucine patch superfamily enzyme